MNDRDSPALPRAQLRNLDMREVEAFTVVTGTRHFGAAASALGITQSAVSQRIARLERTLELRLLRRGGTEVALTADGAALLDRAIRLVAARDGMLGAADALRRNIGRPFRLLVSNAVLPSGLLTVLRDVLRTELSRGRVVVNVVSADAVAGQLLTDQCDLAVSTLPPPGPAITERVLRAMPLGVAVPHGDAGGEVTLAQLFRHKLIVVPRDLEPSLFDGLAAAAAATGSQLELAETVVSFPSVLAMVALGRGWGIVPAALAGSVPAGVDVLPVNGLEGLGILLRLQWPAADDPVRTRNLVRRLVRAVAADQRR